MDDVMGFLALGAWFTKVFKNLKIKMGPSGIFKSALGWLAPT